MSDLLATMERLREAQELERLRAEVAELRARWDDYPAVSLRAARLGAMQYQGAAFGGMLGGLCGEQFGPSPSSKYMQSERFRLFGY